MPNRTAIPEKWTTAGLFDHIRDVEQRMSDRAFCFVLGAGASVTSGIPPAGPLAKVWIEELQCRRDEEYGTRSAAEWATAETLGIDHFAYERVAEFYPKIYDLRFAYDPDEGQASLELIMTREDVSPSVGYSILAQILAAGRHSVVVTTNFDHLVSNALTLYTATEPFVVGHEDLISFIRPKMRRPLVAKIHRDLFLGPMNSPEDMSRLRGDWAKTLRALFRQYTPMVIGYGGNDGTLMGLLQEMSSDDIVGRMIWCYREKDGLPREEVLDTLRDLGGVLVPILGFDEFMLQLGHLLKLPLVAHQIEEVARTRGKRLKEQLEDMRRQLASDDSMSTRRESRESTRVLHALEDGLQRQIEEHPDWWAWELKASGEWNPIDRARLYQEAVAQFPRSPELKIGHAYALLREGRLEEAAESARRAYELDGQCAFDAARIVRRASAPEDAIPFLEHAVQLAPENADVYSEFGEVERLRGRDRHSEELYQRALELNNDHHGALLGYAALTLRSDKHKARRLARRAWALSVPHRDCFSAKAALLLAVIAYSENEDHQPALQRVKAILEAGYERPLSERSQDWLPSTYKENTFHREIADWISDPYGVSQRNLDDPRWEGLETIGPDQPWPEEADEVSDDAKG